MPKKVMVNSDPIPAPQLTTQKSRRYHLIFLLSSDIKCLSQDLPRQAAMLLWRCDAENTVGNDCKVLKGRDKDPAGLTAVFS